MGIGSGVLKVTPEDKTENTDGHEKRGRAIAERRIALVYIDPERLLDFLRRARDDFVRVKVNHSELPNDCWYHGFHVNQECERLCLKVVSPQVGKVDPGAVFQQVGHFSLEFEYDDAPAEEGPDEKRSPE